MRNPWVVVLLLIFLPVVIAANDTQASEDAIFSRVSEAINPPLAPGDTLPSALVQEGGRVEESYPVVLIIMDAGTNQTLGNVHVLIEINNDINYRTLKYVGENGRLELSLAPSQYTLILKADDIRTPGGDYYAATSLVVSGQTEAAILLLPVGSIRGKVEKKGQLIRNAKVSFSCSGLYGDTLPLETDMFGSFTNQWLPPGTCFIRATDGSEVGSLAVDIVPGELQDIKIELETKLSSTSLFLYILLIAIIVIAVITHFYLKKRKKNPRIPETKEPKRIQDVMMTLSPKEKEVITLLIKEGEVTQAKIIYSLMVPKTTLTRILEKLENKHAITIKKYGKSKKICLSDWILEKEKKGP
ncbi:MAG: hypothetical protein ABIJ21_02780 [Nanoarchaeota archaeon]